MAHLKLWEGVLVLEDQHSYLQTPLFHFLPDHQLLGGCCGPERPITVRAFILKGLPPPLSWPPPGLLGVDFCLPPPPPPCPLPLFGLLPLNRLCLFCGLPGEGEQLVELFLIPELLHC